MKKVILPGDSILLQGCGTRVPDMLSDVCTCWQPPSSAHICKCRTF